MDKYTKFILTVIAVGILGLNYHLFSGDIISSANADLAGMNANDLKNDSDFVRAVEDVVSLNCYVDSDAETIYC